MSFSEKARRKEKGSFGTYLQPEVRHLIEKPGLISGLSLGVVQYAYLKELDRWDPALYGSKMSEICVTGNLEGLEMLIETDPSSVSYDGGCDSDLKLGYIAQVVLGAGRSFEGAKSVFAEHDELTRFLCDMGCPVDHEDVVGNTALMYAVLQQGINVAEILVEAGANVNHQNRFGSTPLVEVLCVANGAVEKAVRFLLEHGADLEISNADGKNAEKLYRGCSPKVIAVVENWKKKKLGVEAPLCEKKCAHCDEGTKKLQSCGRCRLAQYCSRKCQTSHWKVHKETCFASQQQQVVVLKPRYDNVTMSSMALTNGGFSGPDFSKFSKGPNGKGPDGKPKEVTLSATNMIVKVKFMSLSPSSKSSRSKFSSSHSKNNPFFSNNPRRCMRVHDRLRKFTCIVREEDDPAQFAELAQVVRDKGTPAQPGGPGVRAYFLADLDNADELKIKLGNVLADQPF